MSFSVAFADYPAVPVVNKATSANQILVTSSEISVNTNLDTVKKVEVKINGKNVDAEIGKDGKIKVGTLIGPKDKVQISIETNSGVVADVKVTKSNDPVSLANVNFATNSTFLNSNAKSILDKVVSIVKLKGYTLISLVGYTDTDGSLVINKELSLGRANAVSSYLKSKGVKAKILVAAKADENPIADNYTREGKALNRRVEIVVS